MEASKLKEILELHRKWLAGDSAGVQADLSGAKSPSFQIVPECGAFEGWKKLSGGYIALVRIPPKARRVSSTGRKCRAEWVIVLEIYTPTGRKTAREIPGGYDSSVVYKKGRTVRPDEWDNDFRVECTHGIHFFLTRKEAEEY